MAEADGRTHVVEFTVPRDPLERFSDANTLEQSEDIFRVLEQMEQGTGMRVLTPQGRLLQGPAAAGRLLAGQKARQIPLLLGYSRGSMTPRAGP